MQLQFLVADDMEINRTLMWKILKPFGKVDFAHDGAQVVEAWQTSQQKKQPYDLIFLDLMMPVMDGQAALKKIRDLEQEADIDTGHQVKVAIVTSLGDWDNALESFKKGIEEYITKPLDREKITQLLRDLNLIEN